MTIWHPNARYPQLNKSTEGTLSATLGIEITEIGAEFLSGTMPVDSRTVQPYGLLHGGASVALAETLGSVAATLCVDPETKFCVGLDINANHVRSARSGHVTGTARPVHVGNRTHVWEIRIVDVDERLICIARLTMAVLDRQ